MSSTDHTTTQTHDDPPSLLPLYLLLAASGFMSIATALAAISLTR